MIYTISLILIALGAALIGCAFGHPRRAAIPGLMLGGALYGIGLILLWTGG